MVINWLNQVESVGEGVTNVAVGDHVIPLYTAGIVIVPEHAPVAEVLHRMWRVQVL